MRKVRVGLVFFLLGLGVLSFASELIIVWTDIEQGACILIAGPEGTGVLIEAGTLNERIPDQPVVDWLRAFSESHPDFQLHYIIATHYHQDHICWIDDLIEAELLAPDGVVYDRGGTFGTATFAQYRDAVAAYRRTISLGQVIELGDGASLQCLVADGEVYQNGSISTTEENDLSLGFLLSYKGFQLWVAGDLGKEVESLAKDAIGDVDVYVVHHHGSGNSSSFSFLDAIKAEVAVCQAGKNTYGHPSIVTTAFILKTKDTDGDSSNGTPLLILQNRGSYFGRYSNVYIADPDGEGPSPGTIELHTDGASYTITAPGFPEPLELLTDGVSRPVEGLASAAQVPASEPLLQESAGQCVTSVILENVQLVYNNHVGNDWYLSLAVNDQPIPFSRYALPQTVWTALFTGSTTITVVATAIEDEKYPDVGRASTTFTIQCPSSSPQTAVLEVLVREDRGRYAGNTALWQFQIRIEARKEG